MLRWALVALVGVTAAWAFRAEASSKPAYSRPPNWVDVAPIPDAPAREGSGGVQILLDDNQSRLSPEGDVYYTRRVVKVLKPEGLSGLTTESVVWNPETETVAINTISIRRDGKVIDLLQGGKEVVVLRRETGLELAMLDGRLTAMRQVDGLQVGDILDFAWTLTKRDPVMRGRSQDPEGLYYPGVTERYRVAISWPTSHPVSWRVTPGFGEPTVTARAGWTELLLDAAGVKPPVPPVGAPARYSWLGRLDASSFRSWEEVSDLIYPLFQKAATLDAASPLRKEVASIAARSKDPKVRAAAALALVEDKTRYFYVGTNDGGYVPSDADETWRRRFGDCKAKTALLLALLKELGVAAQPALVSTSRGDGLDQTLPSLTWFDHVIVRAEIGGKVYWLDGTRQGDVGGLDALRPPSWRWVLPLRSGGAPLEQIVEPPLDQPMFDYLFHVDASKGLDVPAPAKLELRLTGDAAVALRNHAASASREDLERQWKQSYSSSMSWFEPKAVTWSDDPQANMFVLDLTGLADIVWKDNAELHAREFRIPATPAQGRLFPRRDNGPGDDAPFALFFPFYVRGSTEVELPNGGKGFSVHGASFTGTLGGYEIKRADSLDGHVARFFVSVKALTPEVPATETERANKELGRNLTEQEVIRQELTPPAPSGAAVR